MTSTRRAVASLLVLPTSLALLLTGCASKPAPTWPTDSVLTSDALAHCKRSAEPANVDVCQRAWWVGWKMQQSRIEQEGKPFEGKTFDTVVSIAVDQARERGERDLTAYMYWYSDGAMMAEQHYSS